MNVLDEPLGGRRDLDEGLVAICSAVGLDHTGATLLRRVNNAVFVLDRAPVIVRLVTMPSYVPRAALAARAARWFAEHDVPAVRLWAGAEHPVAAGGHVATLWDAVPDTGPRPGGRDLARLLRMLHALPEPLPGMFPDWDPVTNLRNRVHDSPGLADDDRAELLGWCTELSEALADVEFRLPRTLLHGDAHLGNLVAGPDGPVLCDFDSASVGPPEWDLTPVAVADVRFARPPQHQRDLAAGYGFDVTDWPGYDVLRGIRDLKIIAGVFPGEHPRPAVVEEFRRRMDSLRRGRIGDDWTMVRS